MGSAPDFSRATTVISDSRKRWSSRTSRSAAAAAIALLLALSGCTGNGGNTGGPDGEPPKLPDGTKAVVVDTRAPSATLKEGSIRIDQVVRKGRNVAIGMTVATRQDSQRFGGYQLELATNTGVKVPLSQDTEREIPARSVATATVQATLPEDGVQELRFAVGSKLAVTFPIPAADGATVWRPAALRQVGLAQEPVASGKTRFVLDTVRSEGLVTEVTYHATVADGEPLNICAYNFQDNDCRIEEPDGTAHHLIGWTPEASSPGGRSRGTLRFLGELDPTNTSLSFTANIDTFDPLVGPIPLTLPTHADSPTQASAGDLTRASLTLPKPITATDKAEGTSITVTKVDVLADRVQLTVRLKAGKSELHLTTLASGGILDSSSGEIFPMLKPSYEAPLGAGAEATAVLVFQGAVPANVTTLNAHLQLKDWTSRVTFAVPVPSVKPDAPQPEGTLGELGQEPPAPQVTVTPAAPAPAPSDGASLTPTPGQASINDIRPLPVSTSVRVPNPGSWMARQGAPAAPAENPNAESEAQQSLKDLGAKRTPDGWVLTLPETVLFEYNKYDLLPAADATLTKVAKLLGHFSKAEIRVQGHTDSRGDAAGNMTLSKNRADAVATSLSSKGVAASRMAVEGFGAERPVASNATEQGQAKNRRVEIVLREKA